LQGDGCHAAGIDDPLDARAHCLFHEVAGAFDVRGKNFTRVAGPKAIVGRNMKNVAHAGCRTLDGFSVAEVAVEKIQV